MDLEYTPNLRDISLNTRAPPRMLSLGTGPALRLDSSRYFDHIVLDQFAPVYFVLQ